MTIPEPILVTGGAGFIGQNLVNRLLREGYKVSVFDIPGANFPAEWRGKANLFTGDIRHPQDVLRAMDGIRTVFHLAAVVTDAGTLSHHRSVTVGGTQNIMAAAAREKSLVILTSSITVYGENIQKNLLEEDSPWGKPAGYYGTCKQEQEQLARQMAAQNGTELIVIRPANIYGPGSKLWVEGVITELRRGTPSLIGGGDFDAGLCHVSNLVELLMLAAQNPAAIGQVYNAADGFNITWKQYFNDLARIARAPRPKAIPRGVARVLAIVVEKFWRGLRLPGRPPLTYEAFNLVGHPTRFPLNRAIRELRYQPVTSYDQALRELETIYAPQ